MQKIPLTNDYSQTLDTTLGGQAATITVWYQDIGTGWFFSMAFTDGDDIVTGYRINTGAPILTSISSEFIGNIICISTSDRESEPGKSSPWGNTHQLLYLTQDESIEAGLESI